MDFKCSDQRRLELALPLSERMKTILHCSGGVLYSCQVEAADRPGLFVWIGTKYIPVASLEEAETLAKEEYAEVLERERRHQQFWREVQDRRFNYQEYMEP